MGKILEDEPDITAGVMDTLNIELPMTKAQMTDDTIFYVIESPGSKNQIVMAASFGDASKYARQTYGPEVRRATPMDIYKNENDIVDVRDAAAS